MPTTEPVNFSQFKIHSQDWHSSDTAKKVEEYNATLDNAQQAPEIDSKTLEDLTAWTTTPTAERFTKGRRKAFNADLSGYARELEAVGKNSIPPCALTCKAGSSCIHYHGFT